MNIHPSLSLEYNVNFELPLLRNIIKDKCEISFVKESSSNSLYMSDMSGSKYIKILIEKHKVCKNTIMFIEYRNCDIDFLLYDKNIILGELIESEYLKIYTKLQNVSKDILIYNISRLKQKIKQKNMFVCLVESILSNNGYFISNIEYGKLIFKKSLGFFSSSKIIVNLSDFDSTPEPDQQTFGSLLDLTLNIYGSIIAIMSILSKSDGLISEEEAAYIKDTIDTFIEDSQTLSFSEEVLSYLRKELVDIHKKAKDEHTSIEYYAKKLNLNHDILLKYMDKFIEISKIEGITEYKKLKLISIAEIFNIEKDYILDKINIKNENNSSDFSNKDPYEVLGCAKEDNLATIKKKHKQLVKEFHPDNIASKGLAEAFILFANEKLKLINWAYGEIKKDIEK